MLKLDVVPRADVREARTIPTGRDSVRIEFNPNRPPARVRFSLAHEIAHTLFADCPRVMRNRLTQREATADEWQLEALCNIAAAEFLMPLGSLRTVGRRDMSVDRLLEMRANYQVSSEALFIRAAHVSPESCAVFAASRPEFANPEGRYRLDYSIGSNSWNQELTSGSWLPANSVVRECSSIGFTAKGDESWRHKDPWHVECVGIPSYPGSQYPRVLGILLPRKSAAMTRPEISEVVGNALAPRGTGKKLIVQVVNDGTANWGGRGFAQAVRSHWPSVQRDFQDWVAGKRSSLTLGNTRISKVDDNISVASMVCQKGYGPSSGRRIRYSALRQCLATASNYAVNERMSVHMPRIGTGQAGGSWDIIRDLIEAAFCAAGLSVTVYELPSGKGAAKSIQQTLKLAFPQA